MDTWKDGDVVWLGYFADEGSLGFDPLSAEDVST